MVVPSPIYHTNPDETVATLKAVASAGGIPVMIYSNRMAYRVDVTIDVMAELAATTSVRRREGVFGRHPPLDRYHQRLRRQLRPFHGRRQPRLRGAFPWAVGWVAGLVTAFPKEETVAIYRLMKAGRTAEALASIGGSARCSISTSPPISSRTSSLPKSMRSDRTTACACHAAAVGRAPCDRGDDRDRCDGNAAGASCRRLKRVDPPSWTARIRTSSSSAEGSSGSPSPRR